MADIFDEVSEELRQDQLKKIWQKYNKFIFLIIFILFLSVGGFKFYESWKKKNDLNNSNLFYMALSNLEEKKYEKAESQLKKLTLENGTKFKILSLFALADLSKKMNDLNSMENYYQLIIEEKNFDVFYQNLAVILLTQNSKKMSNKEKIKKLESILTSPSLLQPLASELEIIYLFNANKNDEAIKKLDNLLNRSNLDQSQKNRLNIIKEIYKKSD